MSDIVVITVYNVYVCISLVKLVRVFFSLFSAYLLPGRIIPVNKDYQKLQNGGCGAKLPHKGKFSDFFY